MTSPGPNSKELWISFEFIKPEQTINLRKLILWPTIPLEKQLIPSYDFNENTIHLGCFLNSIESNSSSIQLSLELFNEIEDEYINEKEPIGILTLVKESYLNIKYIKIQYQLHKFAIFSKLQNKSIGKKMFLNCIEILKQKYSNNEKILLHFDARKEQLKFYEKCGMIILDENTFWKFGSTGKEQGVEYIKMGNII
ncbi:uncharacterized protein I206_107600 [Kwoniella pini CBS 10737]|uniref:N-acetyltransferase domain-containing protein n=1 Tax=Kwoniella pini CBS 10737 TaxID=1296096 RepID=A0A1B9HXR7_9TREE|nr:uncharacterized protein I206_05933 [Kwoniella pini CBS 10737]OCF48066.1 hypothetical protein I206_05933 [Kwoniella pini CBS 10737]